MKDLSKMSNADVIQRWKEITWPQGDPDPVREATEDIGDELARRLAAAEAEQTVPWCCVKIYIRKDDGSPSKHQIQTRGRAIQFTDYPWVRNNCVCIDERTGQKITYGQMQASAQAQVDRKRSAAQAARNAGEVGDDR